MTTPIVIMTYGRANIDKQLTWNTLTPDLRKRVIFAVRREEAKFFEDLSGVFVLPKSAQNLMTTRQAIWDHFNKKEEYWFQLDDDVKGFRKFIGVDMTKKPMFQTEKLTDNVGWVFDECERVMSEHDDIGTISPKQDFRPPRIPHPDNRWNTSLVVGFNLFKSEVNNNLRYKFVSNYCGDAEMVLTMLAHGYDTVWLDHINVAMMPPTKNAAIRATSHEEWADLTDRWAPYIDFIGDKNWWASPKERGLATNPATHFKMRRSKLLKDARSGQLKPITFSRDK